MSKKKSTTTKKAVAVVATAAAFAACTPMSSPSAEREITLALSGVRAGQMLTKGPLDVLAQTAPAKMPTLTLQSKTVPERRYTLIPGVPAPVALDSYTVTGAYLPNEEGKVFGGSAYATPPFSVNAEITVTEDVGEYSVAASYDCFALVLDESTTEKYRIRGYAGAMMDLAWVYGSDGYKVVYLKGEWTHPALTVTALPADPANYEAASYDLVSDPSASGVLVKCGNWYSFGPNGVQTSEGGIEIGMPGWEAGNE